MYLNHIALCIDRRNLDDVDIELIPKLFREGRDNGNRNYRELIHDVYPILKLLFKYNNSKGDSSFRNVL